MTTPQLPDRARVVVIGGGVIGTSVAYHLGHLGWSDVVLLERTRLTAGTTWHAAGLMVTFGSTSETSTALRRYTRDLYARLEAETGVATGFAPVGFIELATDTDRLEEYRRVAAFNRHCGVDVTEISAAEVAAAFPIARTDDVLAGFHVAGDGKVNPVDVTMSLAAGARNRGVRIVEGIGVTGVTTRGGAVTGVDTDHGHVEAEYVVNCAGMWARQLGESSGVSIPLQAAEHYYLITEQIPGISREWPVIEDPASYGYYREEVGGLLIGLFEPVCAPWMVDRIPEEFAFGEISPDWDRIGPHLETAMTRVPVSATTGVRKLFCGPESFTPDLQPVVGEAPELRNYYVGAGLNSVGILTGGGIGRVLAQWIVDGRPDVDVTGINIDRLRPHQVDPEYRRQRTVEMLGMVYQAHYPTRTPKTARGALLSPLHRRLASQGAYFREVSGWESPDWYGEPGTEPDPGPLTWGRPTWFANWQVEHDAARDAAVLIDMSFMSKFSVEGADSGRYLDRLSAGRVDGTAETITYTQWLNNGGTLEADLTVTKLEEGRFMVVATDTAHRHVETWMRRHAGGQVRIGDVSGELAQINLQGPHSRQIMQKVTAADLSDAVFPFRTARYLEIDGLRVLCVRITYVGELGYELYVPAGDAVAVYDRLWEAGKDNGIRPAGLKSLGSLRMEKAYRDYGHDIDNTDRLWEAGLERFADLGKPGGFIGSDALAEQLAAGPPHRRLVQVLLTDPEPLMHHAEVVHRDGKEVGYLRSASYGFTLGGAVGLAMVEGDEPVSKEWLAAGSWVVDVAGAGYPAVVSLAPLYDPGMKRVRG
jgi:4-methylaminobutanoate oxidase (formaldehyde-forming)